MARPLTLDERIKGCLVGAAIGAELGYARVVEPERFETRTPGEIMKKPLSPARTYRPTVGRIDIGDARALVNVGVRAYVKAKGRATPEDFASVFKDDLGVATPAFWWDGLHTVQESLKEGMPPRLSGLGATTSGLVCACMPAVGAYHFGHPEYAYLDGVELASVVQNRLGADWAGLCAAAIAAAFEPDATSESIIESTEAIAFKHNKELFYEVDWSLGRASNPDEKEFLKLWHARGGAPELRKGTVWVAYNPFYFVGPALRRYGNRPEKMMQLLLAVPGHYWAQSITPVVAGAIVGALGGREVFPKKWRAWAEPIAKPWSALGGVIQRRVKQEARIIAVTEQLAKTDVAGVSLLREKVRGCILAGAIGNAMGSPVEGSFYWEIDKKHPGGVRTVLDISRLENEDDNQAAMMLVETYIANEGLPVMARHLGRTWVEKMNFGRFFPYCMGHAFEMLREGWDPRVIGHWKQVTGSTVMCMEPVGVYHMGDPEFARIDAEAISYMYQRGLDVTCAVMLAATVAEAFRPEATVESVCRAALDAAPRGPLRTFDKRTFKSCRQYIQTCLDIADKYTDVLKARKELYDKCLFYHMIDPLELWGFALAMFKIAKGDVRQAAIGGTNIGRDSDTISGRAAMLSGILRGASNVPKDWIALFKPATLDRIYGNADRLADFIVERKLPNLRKRQGV